MTEVTNEALREFIDVSHEHCRTSTFENMQREMDECGTDYPFGSYKRQVEQVMIATEGDPELETSSSSRTPTAFFILCKGSLGGGSSFGISPSRYSDFHAGKIRISPSSTIEISPQS